MNSILVRYLTFICIVFLGVGCINQNHTPTVPLESALPTTLSPLSPASTSPLAQTVTPTPSETPFPINILAGEIAFAGQGVDKSTGFIYSSIGVASANGQNSRYLVKVYGNELFFYPTWSPDGSYLAYTSTEVDQARENIYIASVDSKKIERLKT